MESLKQKIENHQAKILVVGLGYVGLPTAALIAQKGFNVTGIDIDQQKVNQVNQGQSYIQNLPTSELRELVRSHKLKATANYAICQKQDIILICVPTPLRKTSSPDMSYIENAMTQLLPHLNKGQLLILESTTYPGTTREVLLPLIEEKSFQVGKDFYLAFSPERIDPGNKDYALDQIPKVVGGCTTSCTQLASNFYRQITQKVIPVKNTDTAEMVKLLENTFRLVNIALANEVAIMADKLNVDVWEIINAAATKPFGFMPFYPGPGLGGHCIPIDPQFLAWKLDNSHSYRAKFINLASEVNYNMVDFVVKKIIRLLNIEQKAVNGANILISGIAYKKDVSDTRESPALILIKKLQALGAEVKYHDPMVPRCSLDGQTYESVELNGKVLGQADCVVITTAHSQVDYPAIIKYAKLIIDTRNATGSLGTSAKNVYKL